MIADPSPQCSPPLLCARTSADGRQVVVVVSGEADVSTAELLRGQLLGALAHGPRSLTVDALDLTFCDLRGLAALRDAVQVVEEAGVVVTVRPSCQLSWLMGVVAQATATTGRHDTALDARGVPAGRR